MATKAIAEKRVDFEDIMYGVRVWKEEEDDVVVAFVARRIVGWEDNALLYAKDDDNGCSGQTLDFEDADKFLTGHIKWDGCSNMNFDEQESCMLHFCSRSGAAGVGRLMERLYDLAAELLPKYAEELRGDA